MKDRVQILLLEEDKKLQQLFNMKDKDFYSSENSLGKYFETNLIEMEYIESENNLTTCYIEVIKDSGIELKRGNFIWVKINNINIIKGIVDEISSDVNGENITMSLYIKNFVEFGKEPYLLEDSIKPRQKLEEEVSITSDEKINLKDVREKNISSVGIIYRRYGKKIEIGEVEVPIERTFRHSTIAKAVLQRNKETRNSIKGYFVEKSEKDYKEEDKYFENKPIVVQRTNESDYSFLVRLAKEVNFQFFIRSGWAFFIKADYSIKPEYTFYIGTKNKIFQLLNFEPKTIRRNFKAKYYGDVDLETKEPIGITLVESKGC